VLPFWLKRDDEPLPAAPALLSLTPKYDPEDHGMYFGAIETALTGPGSESVKNLALSGGYGVGKSSILGEVARRHGGSAITISLSTLGFSDKPTDTKGLAKTASTRTNRIQKEIVKQLLYSQDPIKMPGSRYKRVTRFRFWREVGFAALVAVPLTLVFFLSGWSASLGSLVRLPTDGVDWINIPIFFAALAFVVGIRKVMHNRINIERISAGGATIALSAQSATFFDEYLDEIVYFFERTNIDLVIFEDIDRFDDPHIFEALRALNSLLNGAKQLNGSVIRFVYAIKDSIFDELGQRAAQEALDGETDDKKRARPEKASKDEAELELARANPTKFFDQVIPVVPFVTHLSARNLLKNSLDGEAKEDGGKPEGGIEHSVSNEFIDLVGRHLADMRLIKNIRNEFAIFRQRIIVDGSLDLSDDGVLAMVLYKSTHLSDFERIKHRQSDLDKFYGDYRDLVNRNIDRLSAQVRSDRLARQKVTAASSWSSRLGDRLIAYLDDHVASQGARFQSRGLSGEDLDDAALRSPAIWRRIADGQQIVVNYRRSANNYSNVGMSSTFTKDQLTRALNDPINPDAWATTERTRLDKRIATATASIAFLRTASIKQMLTRDEFTLTEEGADSLSKILQRRLGSELARQLVRHGYIDQNFTLYTSTFHSARVSAEATNFMMKNVDTHAIDMSFPLTDGDVEAILREKGRTVLEDDSAYNISFLNYLLRSDEAGTDVVMKRLVQGGENERALILAYLTDGEEPQALVMKLAPAWPTILPFLVSEAGLEEARRDDLVDLALRSMSDEVEYETDESVREFLLERHAAMDAFTSDMSEAAAAQIGSYIDALEIELPSLAPLSAAVRSAVIDVGGYVVNRDNLVLALGEDSTSLALDAMKATHKPVFDHVLNNLAGYLSALAEDEASIVTEDAFVELIGEVLAAAPGNLADVVKRADQSIEIEALATVSTDTWVVLAADHRFPATFANVKGYIDQDGLDSALAGLLIDADEISVEDETAESEKLELALMIIGAKDLISEPSVRARLVASLQLEGTIDASSIPVEEGRLVGHLIGDGVIADDSEAFARQAPEDWPGREYAISRSTAFRDFMSPTEVPAGYVGSLMVSEIVSPAIKNEVLDRFAEFRPKITRTAFDQTIAYAISSGHGLSLEQFEPIASWMQASEVLSLLQPHLATIPVETLISILGSLKGEYQKLAGPTGKRPKFKPTADLNALIARIDELDWVSKVVLNGDEVRVSMKQPPK
jgi:hypothetical protein